MLFTLNRVGVRPGWGLSRTAKLLCRSNRVTPAIPKNRKLLRLESLSPLFLYTDLTRGILGSPTEHAEGHPRFSSKDGNAWQAGMVETARDISQHVFITCITSNAVC